MLLRTVLERLYESGVHTVWLYILDGNEPARRLYQRFGFQTTNDVQPLPDDPTRSEERLSLRLD
jgi:ribosomal protein S18 acetylase RimI-like enzyme